VRESATKPLRRSCALPISVKFLSPRGEVIASTRVPADIRAPAALLPSPAPRLFAIFLGLGPAAPRRNPKFAGSSCDSRDLCAKFGRWMNGTTKGCDARGTTLAGGGRSSWGRSSRNNCVASSLREPRILQRRPDEIARARAMILQEFRARHTVRQKRPPRLSVAAGTEAAEDRSAGDRRTRSTRPGSLHWTDVG